MWKKTFTAGIAAFAAITASAQDAFPAKPVRIVVPYAAGGPADLLARIVGEKLSPRLGQPVLIENKPGSGGHVGGEQVARSAPDGYTLALTTIAHNGAVKLYKNLRYDPTTELVPVVLLAESPSVLLVNDAVPAKSRAPELGTVRCEPAAASRVTDPSGESMADGWARRAPELG